MEQDQLDRSEESMSDYDSGKQEAMVILRDYEGDDYHCVSAESSGQYYLNAEAS